MVVPQACATSRHSLFPSFEYRSCRMKERHKDVLGYRGAAIRRPADSIHSCDLVFLDG